MGSAIDLKPVFVEVALVMRTRGKTVFALAFAMSLSGCYTVLTAPRSLSDYEAKSPYAQREHRDRDELLSPQVGRFEGDIDPYGGYYGSAPYGGYGVPVFGYDSRMGLFGNYGYGGYHPRSGPGSYGYDPYYSGVYGTYVPPGYELVTTDELDRLRYGLTNQPTSTTTSLPDPDEVRIPEQERQEQPQDDWARRTNPRTRKSPTTTPRSTVTKPATSAESKADKPTSSESTSGKSKAKKRQKRR